MAQDVVPTSEVRAALGKITKRFDEGDTEPARAAAGISAEQQRFIDEHLSRDQDREQGIDYGP